MEALAVVILWITEGNIIRKERLYSACTQNLNDTAMRNKDWKLFKTQVMSVVIALSDHMTLRAYLRVLEQRVDRKESLTFAQKIHYKSMMQYVLRSPDWDYVLRPLHLLYPDLVARFPVLLDM